MKTAKVLINGHFKHQPVTGVQRYAREITAQFDKHNFSYSWVQPPDGLRSNALRQLWMQSVMPFRIPENALLWSPTNIGPAWCANQVLTLHDIADQLHPQWFDAKYVAWRRLILPKLLRGVQRVITVSKFSRDSIAEHFPQSKDKIEVIYNGVRHGLFYPRGEDEINKMRTHFNLNKPFVLSVGSLDGRKNICGLIKAWQRLPQKFRREMDLVIAGSSSPKFNFEIRPGEARNIQFIGYVHDEWLPALYSAARVFVYPSLFEGFGLPVLEAMACGTPVVTSNTTSLKELARDHALTVNPSEPGAIAEALEKLLSSRKLCARYEHKGKCHAKTFNWEKTARNITKVFKNSM